MIRKKVESLQQSERRCLEGKRLRGSGWRIGGFEVYVLGRWGGTLGRRGVEGLCLKSTVVWISYLYRRMPLGSCIDFLLWT